MANKVFNISSSIPVRKIVNGDTIYINIKNVNAVPLFQGYDESSNNVVPDWERAGAIQPLLLPEVTSARGNKITLSNHNWQYNGADIVWKNVENGWYVENATKPRFKKRESDGALQIIANLASKDHPSTDTLTYKGTASVGKNFLKINKDVNIVIQKLGSSGFGGGITAPTQLLGKDGNGNDVPETKISSTLYNANGDVNDYTCKWYVGKKYQSGKDGKTFVITKDLVNTQSLIIAEFYLTGSSTCVFRAGLTFEDNTDLFQAKISLDRLPDEGKPATATATLVNVTTGKQVAQSQIVGDPQYDWDIRRKDTWESIKNSKTSSISITVDDIDKNGGGGAEVEVTLDLTVTLNI